MKMRFHILPALTLLAALASGADTTKKAPAKTTTKRIPVKISSSRSRTTARLSPVRVTSKNSKGKSSRAAVYSAPHQASPTPERYKEIQDSLISKGYLAGPATGVWDQNSVDAMKKFQQDKNIDVTGKVTAKALIDLGLGPKDDSTVTANK